jgi:hypothetical protein
MNIHCGHTHCGMDATLTRTTSEDEARYSEHVIATPLGILALSLRALHLSRL